MLGLCVLAVLTAASGKTSVLVLDVESDGSIDGKRALAITSVIAGEVANDPKLDVLTMIDVRDALGHDEEKRLLGCGQEAECYTKTERLEKMDLVVATSAGSVGNSLTLTLSLFEPKTAVVRGRASAVLDKNAPMEAELKQLVGELFGRNAQAEAHFALPDGHRSFAVLDLVPTGVDAEAANALTQILSTELKRIKGASVIGRDDIKAMLALEAEKQLLGCAGDTSCMAEIGSALGVDYIVAGHVGRLSGTFVVALRLIEPDSLLVKSRVTESFQGKEEQLVGAVRHAVRRLVGSESDATGTLVLRVPDAGGDAWLDGQVVDRAQPIEKVTVGRHALRLSLDGYADWQSDVYVEAGQETVLSIEPDVRERRWYESWIFWAAVGTVAAAAAGTGIGLALTQGENGPGIVNDPTYPFGLQVSLPGR